MFLSGNERPCYTFKIPETLANVGIYQVSILFERDAVMDIFLHQQGLLLTDLPSSSPKLDLKNSIYGVIPTEYEKFEMLDYAGDKCVTDADYNLDKCRLEYIHNQTISIFGCTTPFGNDMRQICKDNNQSRNASNFFFEQFSER